MGEAPLSSPFTRMSLSALAAARQLLAEAQSVVYVHGWRGVNQPFSIFLFAGHTRCVFLPHSAYVRIGGAWETHFCAKHAVWLLALVAACQLPPPKNNLHRTQIA